MQPPSYITTLTPLRGIAAILVLIFHSGIFLYPVAPDTCTLLHNGWLWVDFFFVLSGFIMAHVYGSKFQQRVDRRNYKHYLQARFARVYPLHLITLSWALVGRPGSPLHVPIIFTWRALAPVMGIKVPQGFITQQPVFAVGWLYCAALLLLTLLTASVFYRCIEVPARNYLNRQASGRLVATT